MEELKAFLVDHLVVVICAVLFIGLILKVVKSVVKYLLTVLIIVGLVVFALQSAPEPIKDVGNKVVEGVSTKVRDEAIATLITMSKVTYTADTKNGSYVIEGNGITLKGNKGSKTAELVVAGQRFDVSITQVLSDFVTRAEIASKK